MDGPWVQRVGRLFHPENVGENHGKQWQVKAPTTMGTDGNPSFLGVITYNEPILF